MRIGFIVAEYNPLHNGHIKHIQKTKEDLHCDSIVVVMSGDIVQRGELAIVDKYTRATWAIEAGADMVIELPVEYTLGSAQVFATGASKLISYFDAEKYISFGSECGSTYVLEKVVEMLDSEENQGYIREFLNEGNTYAKANALAFSKYLNAHNIDQSITSILDTPNNILGLEYIRAIKYMDVKPYTIKREGSYNSSLDKDNPSALSIREALYKKDPIFDMVPSFVAKDLGNVKDNREKLFSVIKYELSKKQNLDKIFGMHEGLHNRFLSFLSKSSTYEEFMQNVKTKRFTMTSLSRSLMCALIDNTYTLDQVLDLDVNYINVLAIKDKKQNLLSTIDTNVVTKPSELMKLKDRVDTTLQDKSESLFKAINYEYEPYMRIVK